MDGMEADRNENDLKALRALQADASELERIQSLLNRFNVFETIGFVSQELMHSRFLAFLLDPRQNHGLGSLFLKRVLREMLSCTDETPLPTFFENLDQINLDETLVRREHQQVDILLTNKDHKLAVIIENKIWTTEHSDQLDRYYQQVMKDYPGWQVLGIYLTPFGDIPSHRAYLPLSYGVVCDIVESIREDRDCALSPNVWMTMENYTDMVRRNIVGDAEVANLSRSIYQKHKRAFDLIFKYRPDVQAETRDLLEALVMAEPRVDLDKGEKSKIRFGIRKWDTPNLVMRDMGSEFGRILEFQLWNFPPSLEVVLFITGGSEETRRNLFDMVKRNPNLLRVIRSWGSWSMIFKRRLLGPRMYEDATEEERTQEIHRQWAAFLEEDLPRIEAALKKESWIWESVEADG
jgi:hypothetical protein